MISNLVLQNTVDGLKKITKSDMTVLDATGHELASTVSGKAVFGDVVHSFIDSDKESQIIEGDFFLKIYDEDRVNYVLVVMGDNKETQIIGKMACL